MGGAKACYAGHIAQASPHPIPFIGLVGGRWGTTLIGALGDQVALDLGRRFLAGGICMKYGTCSLTA